MFTLLQVVAIERKSEKGLFAALDAKLKAEKLRFKVCAAQLGVAMYWLNKRGEGVTLLNTSFHVCEGVTCPKGILYSPMNASSPHHTQDVFDQYRGARPDLNPEALLKLLVHLLPDLKQGDLMYFQVRLALCVCVPSLCLVAIGGA